MAPTVSGDGSIPRGARFFCWLLFSLNWASFMSIWGKTSGFSSVQGLAFLCLYWYRFYSHQPECAKIKVVVYKILFWCLELPVWMWSGTQSRFSWDFQSHLVIFQSVQTWPRHGAFWGLFLFPHELQATLYGKHFNLCFLTQSLSTKARSQIVFELLDLIRLKGLSPTLPCLGESSGISTLHGTGRKLFSEVGSFPELYLWENLQVLSPPKSFKFFWNFILEYN